MCGVSLCSHSSLLPPLLSIHPPSFLSSSHLLASFISFVSSHLSSSLLHFSPIPSPLPSLPFPQAAEECGSLEIHVEKSALSQDKTDTKKVVRKGQLFSLSGESMESCAEVPGATSTIVGSSMAQLPTTFNQGVQYETHSSII